MATPLRLSDSIETTVRFVEDTPADAIVPETVARLKNGEDPLSLLRAAAFAVSRSSALPTDHHGGPVHPIAGIPSVLGAARRLEGDWALMPVVHSVALANKHVNHPEMGPVIMPALSVPPSEDPAADKQVLREAIQKLEPHMAERQLLKLLPRCTPGEILDLMLERASRWNPLDDHYFLYPVYAMRAVETLGWDSAAVLLRPAVRFIASNPSALGLDVPGEMSSDYVARNVAAYYQFEAEAARLTEKHALDTRAIPIASSPEEDQAVIALAERIGTIDAYKKIPALIAEALGGGLSLDGVAEAMSVGGAMIHMRTDYGNPFDVHFTTGINARRWLIRLPEVSQQNKVLALLSWSASPEIRLAEPKMAWPVRPSAAELAVLPERDQAALLDAIQASIVAHPRLEELRANPVMVSGMRAYEQTRQVMLLAWQYLAKGFDREALFRRVGEIMCRDDFAEMHTFKHLQATTEEYATSRPAHRDFHLVSAVKVAAITYGLYQDVYDKAKSCLAV